MIGMLLKISVRNLLKNKLFSIINVTGLALGFSAFILISLFVRYELNWDKSNVYYDRIYRIQRHYKRTMYAMDGNDISPNSRAVTAQLIEKQFPEIKKVTVIREIDRVFMAYDPASQVYNIKGIFADSCFFDVFTYKFIEGSQTGSLDEPFSIVLSKTMADRLFGGKRALGEAVVLEKKFALNVTGVYEDLPENSTRRPDYIVSFSSLAKVGGIKRSDIGSGDCMTYALLNPGADYKVLESKIKNVFSGFKGIEFEELQLCPMKNIYLNFNGRGDYIVALLLYGLIGLFILVMSAFNYINLTIANASVRGKEVAMKKVCGSSRSSLIIHFLGETILSSVIAVLLAFEIASSFLPLFSGIINKHLTLSLKADSGYVFMIIAISIFLILLTLSFSLHIRYLLKKNLGFDKEHILFARMSVSNQEVTFDQLRNRVLQHSEIEDAFMCQNLPFVTFGGGMTNREGGDPNEKINCRFKTIFNIFLAMIGLFGLVSFTVVRRTKEIGIRKINGSSTVSIYYLLSRDYYIMLLVAIMISFPAAYWTYTRVPGANKLPPQVWVYLLSIGIISVIILLTTSYLTIKASRRNPVEALRYE
jgi:putative ABC transport system permease protein